MERTDIEYFIDYEDFESFKPSQRARIKNGMWDKSLWTYKDICVLPEEKFKSFDFVDDKVFTAFKKHLGKYGLGFGMLPRQIEAYMDADYLANHSEEQTSDDERNVPETKLCEKTLYLLPQELRHIIDAAFKKENVESIPTPIWDEESRRKHFSEKIERCRDYYSYFENEYMHIHCTITAYKKLPWYYNLFPERVRTAAAVRIGEQLFADYKEAWISRLVGLEHCDFLLSTEDVKKRNDENAARRQQIIEDETKKFYSSHPDAKLEETLHSDIEFDKGCLAEEFRAALLGESYKYSFPKIKATLCEDEI